MYKSITSENQKLKFAFMNLLCPLCLIDPCIEHLLDIAGSDLLPRYSKQLPPAREREKDTDTGKAGQGGYGHQTPIFSEHC